MRTQHNFQNIENPSDNWIEPYTTSHPHRYIRARAAIQPTQELRGRKRRKFSQARWRLSVVLPFCLRYTAYKSRHQTPESYNADECSLSALREAMYWSRNSTLDAGNGTQTKGQMDLKSSWFPLTTSKPLLDYYIKRKLQQLCRKALCTYTA